MISAGSGLGESAGGMIVYFEGLLSGLARLDPPLELRVFTRPHAPPIGLPTGVALDTVACIGLPSRRTLRVAYEHLLLPRLVARSHVDVLLSTCNTKPLSWYGRSVVVLQSLQYLLYPRLFGPTRLLYLRAVVPRSLRAADAVIAVSDWERNVAIERFGLDAGRVFTVHHGVSMAAQSAASDGAPPRRGDEEIRQPYVVMVSTFYSYKNHRRLIKAFAQLIKEHRLPHRLVLAGGDGDVTRTELEHTARRVGVADRVSFTGPIKHGAVPALLKGADAVAYVSECETFGHPVVEALAMGRPLVTSAVASMPEIAGNAAVLVDPFNVESIARGLAMALLDMELRDRLAYDGPRRAATFTWSRCAEETAAVLQFAVERPKRGPTHA